MADEVQKAARKALLNREVEEAIGALHALLKHPNHPLVRRRAKNAADQLLLAALYN